MDSTNDSASALQEDVNILRQEYLKMETKRDALLKQIEQEEKAIQEETKTLGLPPANKADKEQRRMQEIMMAYRLTGVTLFTEDELETHDELDLDLDETPPEAKKQIGIRFETFALSKYHEPYYVMIKLSQPDKENIPPAGSQDAQQPTMTFQISNHTIPHWIPLRDLEKRYLNRDMSTFTTRISEYLQAFVTRREYISRTIHEFNSAVQTIFKLYQHGHTLPQMELRSQDAAIRGVVLLITRYDALFQLLHMYRTRANREIEKSKRSILGAMDMDIDVDLPSTDSNEDKEEGLLESEKTALEGMRGLKGSAAFAQIHLVYDDLTSTKPTEVQVKFANGNERIRIEKLPSGSPMRNQYNHWVKILKTEESLVDALDRIADLYRIDRVDES
ncbi:hypothetical protein EMPS_00152 [Entomortierella parvispora]|uniref:Uncharacterized protein n=1 Tax=Entomortierella parvispora TaxID=205924 RepID=A0A9P3GZI6_9FUNG|nr:hypothetical protein EMPS_00152 [Entomortierella parvispora]